MDEISADGPMTEGDDDTHAILARLRQQLDQLPLTEEGLAQLAPSLTAAAQSITNQAIMDRVRQELAQLPLTDKDIASLAPPLAAASQFILITDPHSRFFDFSDKVNAVVQHFAGEGLTLPAYLQAVSKYPQLLTRSPTALIANLTGVVEHFAADGLTTRDYLKAVLKKPQLLNQTPATIAKNIAGVVERFAPDGLTSAAYLHAALATPSLFGLTAATVAGNINAVVERFAADGLTTRDYLRATRKKPQLFYQSPATITRNITGVVEHFAAEGLTTRDYLQAALKQPQLFYQSPATIIGHVNLIIDLHRQGLVRFPGEESAPPDQPLRPLFAFLVQNPMYLTLAADNFTLREVSARVREQQPRGTALLTAKRHRVESELAEALGRSDAKAPVAKVERPAEGSDLGPHARNLLLRALIREGLVKGTLER